MAVKLGAPLAARALLDDPRNEPMFSVERVSVDRRQAVDSTVASPPLAVHRGALPSVARE
jgi:hypothetical protein